MKIAIIAVIVVVAGLAAYPFIAPIPLESRLNDWMSLVGSVPRGTRADDIAAMVAMIEPSAAAQANAEKIYQQHINSPWKTVSWSVDRIEYHEDSAFVHYGVVAEMAGEQRAAQYMMQWVKVKGVWYRAIDRV